MKSSRKLQSEDKRNVACVKQCLKLRYEFSDEWRLMAVLIRPGLKS